MRERYNCCFLYANKIHKREEEKKKTFPLEHRSSGTGDLSSLSSIFTDTQRTLRLWLEHVEQSLLNDKIRIVDIHTITIKKKVYKDLLDQTFEQERNLETLNELARESYSKLTIDVSRRLQQELINYKDRLLDIKMFLTDRLAKYNRYEKTLTEFEVKGIARKRERQTKEISFV